MAQDKRHAGDNALVKRLRAEVGLVAKLDEQLVFLDREKWMAEIAQRGGAVVAVRDVKGLWPGWTHLMKVEWEKAGPYTVYAVRLEPKD